MAPGRYPAAKPSDPTGPENTVAFLQDGGEEATTFAEIENIQINKVGQGPYADFSDAKVGDVLLIQSQVDPRWSVRKNAGLRQPTYWDFGLQMYAGKAEGPCPAIDEAVTEKSARPVFSVAQDTYTEIKAQPVRHWSRTLRGWDRRHPPVDLITVVALTFTLVKKPPG